MSLQGGGARELWSARQAHDRGALRADATLRALACQRPGLRGRVASALSRYRDDVRGMSGSTMGLIGFTLAAQFILLWGLMR